MVLMPGFQSTQLATEGALEPFFFLYTDDSIQGNLETCKQSSIMLNYEVKNRYTKIGVVEIGNNVYIGYNVTILCNVRIGSDVIIGAGSVVTSDIPSGSVFAGNPARYICDIDAYRKKHNANLEDHLIYDGPCSRWHQLGKAEKNKMKNELRDSFGYMK